MRPPTDSRPLALLLALAALAAACGDPDPSGPGDRRAPVEVSPAEAQLTALGDTQQFEALTRDGGEGAEGGADVAWSVIPDSVARIGPDGRAVAEGRGRAEVRAAVSGETASATLTVDPVPAELRVSPDSAAFLALGDTASFDVTPVDANGNPLSGPRPAWSSSDTSVAAVDSAGRAMARGAGRAAIGAEAVGATGEAGVTLWASEVEAEPAADTVAAGDAAGFDATARDAGGNRLDGADLAWRSLAPEVAAVDSAGRATGTSPGEAAIVAVAAGGARDTALLRVEENPGPDRDLVAVGLDLRPTGVLTDGTTTAELVVRTDGAAPGPYEWRITEAGTELASGTRSDPPPVDTVAVPGLGPFARGVHELTLTVDPEDAVAEADEGNNRAEAPLDSRPRGFRLETRLVGRVSQRVRLALPEAVSRWEEAITGDLRDFDPDALEDDSLGLAPCVDGDRRVGARTEPVDDVLLLVREDAIDGEGGALARAGPCWVRPPADPAGELARMPIVGQVTVDSADTGLHYDVIRVLLVHEIGHALGLLFGPDVQGPSAARVYTGAAGVARYRALGGTEPTPPMTGGSHWLERAFGNELMTPLLTATSPMSTVTIGALADRSYAVDYSAAGDYTLGVMAADVPGRGVHVGEDGPRPRRVRVVDPSTGTVRLLEHPGGDGGPR